MKGGVAQTSGNTWRAVTELEVNRQEPVYYFGKVTEDHDAAVLDYKKQLLKVVKDLAERIEKEIT